MKNLSYISEIYSAVQGEGPLVGVRQIFVRFSVCDLRCVWCDTPGSLNKTKVCLVEQSPGKREFKKNNNPVHSDELIKICSSLDPIMHHSLSITGGEPLLQWKFLKSFLPGFKNRFNIPVYLESGGHKPNELTKVIEYLDFISMDFKLPSSAYCGDLWDKHFDFLKISINSNAKTWVKIVVSNKTDFNELEYALKNIKSVSVSKNDIQVILQPVTAINNVQPPDETTILGWQSSLIGILPDIRIIPQTHKFINQK